MLLPEKIISDDSLNPRQSPKNIETLNRGLSRKWTKTQFILTSPINYGGLAPRTLLKYAELDLFTPVNNRN
jgi:hypothetical protein